MRGQRIGVWLVGDIAILAAFSMRQKVPRQ
jgi:hypothetical protein